MEGRLKNVVFVVKTTVCRLGDRSRFCKHAGEREFSDPRVKSGYTPTVVLTTKTTVNHGRLR